MKPEYQPLINDDEKKESVAKTSAKPNVDNNRGETEKEEMVKAQNAVTLASWQLKFASRYAVPAFYCIAIGAVVLMVLYFTSIMTQAMDFFIILGLTYLGAALGSYMTFKYGTLQDAINLLKQMNDDYGHEIDVLRASSTTLSKEVSQFQTSIDALQQNQQELENHLQEFDELNNQLQSICKDNENVGDAVTRVNSIMYDMKDVIKRNESAQLLSLYYDCAFRDGNLGLSKEEYTRFLARLSVNQRKRFEEQGSFEQILKDNNEKDEMSLKTFLKLLQTILEAMDEELLSMVKT